MVHFENPVCAPENYVFFDELLDSCADSFSPSQFLASFASLCDASGSSSFDCVFCDNRLFLFEQLENNERFLSNLVLVVC